MKKRKSAYVLGTLLFLAILACQAPGMVGEMLSGATLTPAPTLTPTTIPTPTITPTPMPVTVHINALGTGDYATLPEAVENFILTRGLYL